MRADGRGGGSAADGFGRRPDLAPRTFDGAAASPPSPCPCLAVDAASCCAWQRRGGCGGGGGGGRGGGGRGCRGGSCCCGGGGGGGSGGCCCCGALHLSQQLEGMLPAAGGAVGEGGGAVGVLGRWHAVRSHVPEHLAHAIGRGHAAPPSEGGQHGRVGVGVWSARGAAAGAHGHEEGVGRVGLARAVAGGEGAVVAPRGRRQATRRHLLEQPHRLRPPPCARARADRGAVDKLVGRRRALRLVARGLSRWCRQRCQPLHLAKQLDRALPVALLAMRGDRRGVGVRIPQAAALCQRVEEGQGCSVLPGASARGGRVVVSRRARGALATLLDKLIQQPQGVVSLAVASRLHELALDKARAAARKFLALAAPYHFALSAGRTRQQQQTQHEVMAHAR